MPTLEVFRLLMLQENYSVQVAESCQFEVDVQDNWNSKRTFLIFKLSLAIPTPRLQGLRIITNEAADSVSKSMLLSSATWTHELSLLRLLFGHLVGLLS
jgi:hypothetical protein